MELRTTFPIVPSAVKINYQTPTVFIGSCFASEIGKQIEEAKFKVLINPSGTVYNPVSVANTLEFIIKNKSFMEKDLYKFNDQYISFYHYTDYSSGEADVCLRKINEMARKAHSFLSEAKFLFITFGTARVYRLRETGEIVSNCHKIPASNFIRELLTVDEVVTRWERILDELKEFNKNLNIVFTVSPVRHWKDGPHGNQVSKSVLFLAIEELLAHSVLPQYFPAYELIMDDLRDYRFFADDMLHPSAAAINYIWDAFTRCFMENNTLNIRNEVIKVSKALNHRLTNNSSEGTDIFAEKMLKQISDLEIKVPSIDFERERNYFLKLKNK